MTTTPLADIAPTFVEIAHRIVWCTVATVDTAGRPRTRILHPIWEWDASSSSLVGWIATSPDSLKGKHLARLPFVSLTYWDPAHDVATAEADTSWHDDEASRTRLWHAYKDAPPPVGYDPAMIPGWDEPMSPGFGALRLDPVRLHVIRALDFANATTWQR